MPVALNRLTDALRIDPGLHANVSASERSEGIAAAASMNAVLLKVIAQKGLNADGLITPEELAIISRAVQNNAADYAQFLKGHGNDEGNTETGYHLLQNDGGTLEFRGRDFADTVADAIYHYGFDVTNGRYVNEDGNANETTIDVAGWLNFFLNGVSTVFGSNASDSISSGTYSDEFAAARNETFRAGDGDDSIWADLGDDYIYGGRGDDKSGGSDGNDTMKGEDGNDSLYGDAGDDVLSGGDGKDEMGAGLGNDRLYGGRGNDRLSGAEDKDSLSGGTGDDVLGGGEGDDEIKGGVGNDTLYGDEANDQLYGGAGDDQQHGSDGDDVVVGKSGNDALFGGSGDDTVMGGTGDDELRASEGADVLYGGTGADSISLWEDMRAADRLVFASGDSGRTAGTIDRVEGFEPGEDKIDLTSFGAMTFEDIDFSGDGGSVYFDGTYLRIDVDGDRATDMMVEFAWINELSAGDFLFG